MASPKFISEAKRQGIRVAPCSGKEVARIIELMTGAPPQVVDQYKKFLGLKK